MFGWNNLCWIYFKLNCEHLICYLLMKICWYFSIFRKVFLLFVFACVSYVFLFNWSWYLRPKNQKLEKPLIQRELPKTLEINEEFTTIHNCSKQSGNQSTGHTVDFKTNVTYVTTKPKPAGPLREESCDIETTLLYLRTNTSILLDNFTDLLTSK